MADETAHDDDNPVQELEIKLAFQDHKIAALDELVRALAARLDKTERELAELKQAVRSPELPLGPPTEIPPHY